MNNKIDVFKIMAGNTEENQEQQNAPDFDFLNIKELMTAWEQERGDIVSHEPELSPIPEIEPIPEFEPISELEPVPEFELIPEFKPDSELEPFPELEPPAEPEPAPVTEPEPGLKPPPIFELEPERKPKSKRVSEPSPEPEPVLEFDLEPDLVLRNEPAPVTVIKTKNEKNRRNLIKKIIPLVIVVILLMINFSCPKITVDSMDPIISSGDRVLVARHVKRIKKNDIIVFKNDENKKLVARIVAVDGDVVSLNDVGGLYINNSLQSEEHIHTVTTITDTGVSYPVIVSDEKFFVLGDNRTDSVDSRDSSVGLVEKSDITGKVIFCFKRIK